MPVSTHSVVAERISVPNGGTIDRQALSCSEGPERILAAGAGVGAALAAAMAEPQTAFNQQTALRLACNAFVQPSLRTWIATQVHIVTPLEHLLACRLRQLH